ncbi:MAG: hypothetical protein MI922_17715, partial [Bacteroidales bacterium]|nr:hypothetical protein [Bacteroidales bacterium]
MILLSLIATIGMVAQDYKEIRFENYSIEHGLPNTQVACVLQDSDGFIWFATRGEGVSRYDGIRFKHYKYNDKDSTSLEHININDIYEDSKGRLWFAGTTGMAVFNKSQETFINFKPVDLKVYNRGNNVKRTFEDSRGIIWIGSTTGLAKIVMDSITGGIDTALHYHHNVNGKKSPVGIVTTINEDNNGILWLGTRKGLYLFDVTNESYTRVHSPLLNKSNIEAITIHNDYIWVGATGGIYRINMDAIDYNNIQFEHYLNPSLINSQYQLPKALVVNYIGFDYNGTLWGATNSGLLIIKNPYAIIDDNNLQVYKRVWADKTSLAHNNVLWLTFDKDNIAWIGTRNGVSKYDKYRYKFKTYKQLEGAKNTFQASETNFFGENIHGDYMVVAHRVILDLISTKTGKIVALPEGLTNWGLMYHMLCDSNNSFWITTTLDKRPALVHMTLPGNYINNPRPGLIQAEL